MFYYFLSLSIICLSYLTNKGIHYRLVVQPIAQSIGPGFDSLSGRWRFLLRQATRDTIKSLLSQQSFTGFRANDVQYLADNMHDLPIRTADMICISACKPTCWCSLIAFIISNASTLLHWLTSSSFAAAVTHISCCVCMCVCVYVVNEVCVLPLCINMLPGSYISENKITNVQSNISSRMA